MSANYVRSTMPAVTAVIAGNLGKDAEGRYTQSGKFVLNFSVAVNGYANGEKTTTWVRCAFWGERAEKLEDYLTKGTKVVVQANSITVSVNADDPEGKYGIGFEVDVREITLMGGGESNGETRGHSRDGYSDDHEDFEDKADIPF